MEADNLLLATGVGRDCDYGGLGGEPSAPARAQIDSGNPQVGNSPSICRLRNAPTRSSMCLQSLDTWLFEMPVSPMAWTRSSTLRVDTPAIHGSWMTAMKDFSDVLRGSRNGGE